MSLQPQTPIVNAGLKYVNGLLLSNSPLAPNTQLVLGAGQARDSSNVNDMLLSNDVALDGLHVGANGMDVAVLAPNGMYAVYLIGDSTENQPIAGLLSLASNAQPFLPFGYDMFRLIGYVSTNAALLAHAASTAPLTVVYANGASGVGATLTNAGTQAVFALDGDTLAVGQVVLIKDQASALQNGVYVVSNAGSPSTNWVLTRATNFDQPAEIDSGVQINVAVGTVNAGLIYRQNNNVTTVGIDALNFVIAGGAVAVALNLFNEFGNNSDKWFYLVNPVSVINNGTSSSFVEVPLVDIVPPGNLAVPPVRLQVLFNFQYSSSAPGNVVQFLVAGSNSNQGSLVYGGTAAGNFVDAVILPVELLAGIPSFQYEVGAGDSISMRVSGYLISL